MTTKAKAKTQTIHVVTNAVGNHAAFSDPAKAAETRDRLNTHTHFSTPYVVVEMELDPETQADKQADDQQGEKPPE